MDTKIQRITELIAEELRKVIVGKDEVIRKVLMTILAGGHILLEDVPGVGKTTLALGLSKALNLNYRRMQFTMDTMASDITGFSVIGKDGNLEYKPGAVLCNLFLADEINRTSAKTQAALLEVMEEGGVTVDGVTHETPQPFICVATQNPLGSAGTQKLPDSQLDRFMVRLSMGYPDVESQIRIVQARELADPMEDVKKIVTAEHLLAMRGVVRRVYMHEDVIRYAADLCERTRNRDGIEQGVSPRAVLALTQMSKAGALMEGREYVLPQDVKRVFVDVCAHRLVLTSRARVHQRTEAQILEEILSEVPVPQIAIGS